MNMDQAVKMAKRHRSMQAVLIEGIPAVVGRKDAEKAEERGAEIGWLYRHKGRVVCIPGCNE